MTETLSTPDQIDLDRLRAGDKAVFAQVVELYADRLYNLALKISGDALEAEDILQ